MVSDCLVRSSVRKRPHNANCSTVEMGESYPRSLWDETVPGFRACSESGIRRMLSLPEKNGTSTDSFCWRLTTQQSGPSQQSPQLLNCASVPPGVGLMRPCLVRDSEFRGIPETDGLLGTKKRKRPWSHSLGVTQTWVGGDCCSATSRNTRNLKAVLYVASGLETSCQSLEACELELRGWGSSGRTPH